MERSESFYSDAELEALGIGAFGENVLISRKVSLYGAKHITIGSNVRIDDFCVLSGKITLGSYIHIAVGCCLFGSDVGITMEDFTTISSRCAVYAISDDYSGESVTNPMLPEELRNVQKAPVCIAKHGIVGAGSTLLPGATVAEGAAVGSMSLVNRPLEPWGIYAGVPCRKIKERSKKLLELEAAFVGRVGKE